MNKLLAGAVCVTFAFGGQAFAQQPAQPSKGSPGYSQKVLHEDEKVRVNETTYKPGASGPSNQRPYRVVRYLSGGTFERTYADGRKEKVEIKTGEVRVAQADKVAYSNKNVGKTDIVIYGVQVKEAKK